MFNRDLEQARMDVERLDDWRGWIEKIPFIQFPSDWMIKVIPPFGGAIARFLVMKGNKRVSIYLDAYSRLGCSDDPYWEVYPHEDDVFRCSMEDTESLLKAITESLEGNS